MIDFPLYFYTGVTKPISRSVHGTLLQLRAGLLFQAPPSAASHCNRAGPWCRFRLLRSRGSTDATERCLPAARAGRVGRFGGAMYVPDGWILNSKSQFLMYQHTIDTILKWGWTIPSSNASGTLSTGYPMSSSPGLSLAPHHQ